MLGFITPYLGWVKLGAVALMLLGAFVGGHHYATLQQRSAELKIEQAQQLATEAKDKQLASISSQLEAAKNGTQIRTQTITRNVDHYINTPVYNSECFDARGLSDANRALTGNDTSKSPDAVPTAPTTH